jgi:Family of unknown function (DUF6375)
MKIWHSFGSEHSMNLVMIGHFIESKDAAEVMELINEITEQVNRDVEDGFIQFGGRNDRYSPGMLEFLGRKNLACISPDEAEQFAMDISHEKEGNDIVVTTNESEVSAFLKLLIERGAKVEVYSAHFHKGTGHGR